MIHRHDGKASCHNGDQASDEENSADDQGKKHTPDSAGDAFADNEKSGDEGAGDQGEAEDRRDRWNDVFRDHISASVNPWDGLGEGKRE